MGLSFRFGSVLLILALGWMPGGLAQEVAPPVAGVLAPPMIEPGARELLEATQARYRALKSYAGRVERRSTRPNTGEWAEIIHFDANLAWEKPGRIRIERLNLAGERRAIAVSDGKMFHAFRAKQPEFYIERAANEYSFLGAFSDAGSYLYLTDLMQPEPIVASLQRQGLTSLRLLPNQNLDGVEMRSLEAQLLDDNNVKITATVLIGATDGLLHRVNYEEVGRFTVSETHREIRTDPTLPASTWEFTPPANAKAVEELMVAPMPLNFKIGDYVPDFKAPTLDNKRFSLADTDGTAVILHFFNINGPGSTETGELMETQKKFGKENLSLVGVSMDGLRERVEKFAADKALTYPILYEGTGWGNSVATRFGIRSMPKNLFIGRDGTLKFAGFTIDELVKSGTLEAELGAKAK